MSEETNLRIIRDAYEAFGRGDIDAEVPLAKWQLAFDTRRARSSWVRGQPRST
jgi:hypothetical protein